jgi:hypothetical protein
MENNCDVVSWSYFEDAVRHRHDAALPENIRESLFHGVAGRFFVFSESH